MKYLECPTCGQDLNLSPGAESELEEAYLQGYVKGVKSEKSKKVKKKARLKN